MFKLTKSARKQAKLHGKLQKDSKFQANLDVIGKGHELIDNLVARAISSQSAKIVR